MKSSINNLQKAFREMRQKLIRSLIVCLMLAVSITACQASAPTQEEMPSRLTVFAAASLTEAFTDIGEAFTASHPGVEIVYNFAGSQQLVQQLSQGAPADVFASANQSQMEAAVGAGRVEPDSSDIFASNELVVILPRENPAGVSELKDLAQPGLKFVLAAQEVPAGDYSIQFLEKASEDSAYGTDFSEKVLANVVSYEENVRSVYSKVALGEADAGIVYITDVPKGNPDGVEVLIIPPELNVVAEYPLAPVTGSPNASLAQAFIDFVLSPQGQAILSGYGFSPPR